MKRKLVFTLMIISVIFGMMTVTANATTFCTYENGFCTVCDGYEPAMLNGDVYEISNAGQLYWFAAQVNDGNAAISAKLMENIVVNENVLAADGSLNGDGSNFRVWTPMGRFIDGGNTYEEIAFTGTFDGNGKTVSGLYFNDSSFDYVGLFGYSRGTINNVGVVDNYFVGGWYVGGVVGQKTDGDISDCYNTGNVSGVTNVGGVAGASRGTASNCNNTGSVSGTGNFVGGVFGSALGSVHDCYNTGEVGGDAAQVGGVIGASSATVSNCHNTGSVSGGGYAVGGVAGDIQYYTVSNCYNTGSVSGTGYAVGGVAGISYGTLINSYNTGNVSGVYTVGGVIGYGFSNGVTNSYYLTGCATDCEGFAQSGIGGEQGIVGSATEDVAGCTIGMSAVQFASGEVCYLLQGDQTEQVWGQMIGTDPSPVFSDDKVYLKDGIYYNRQACEHSPVYSFDGTTHTVTCALCGESASVDSSNRFAIYSTHMELSSDINLIYRCMVPEGFTNPHIVFTVNGINTTVYPVDVDDKGMYLFKFEDITPQMIGDNISATLYATLGGMEISDTVANYSALAYCTRILNGYSDMLKDVVSDLLIYCEKAQLFTGYKTDKLVTEGLEDLLTPGTFPGTGAITNKQNVTGTKSNVADIKSASLTLSNKIAIRVNFAITGDTSAYTYKFTMNGKEYDYGADALSYDESTGRYYIVFSEFQAYELDDVITVVILDGDTQIGRTLEYSVNTYIQKNAGVDSDFARLLQAIYNYGESAKAYAT